MCYSPEVSIGTFGFVSIVCIYAWIRNKGIDRAAALIFFVIVLMQLLEYFLWINQSCTSLNKLLSSFVPILLLLQPLLLSYIVWKMNAGHGVFTPHIFYTSLLVFIPILLYAKSFGIFNTCILKGKDGHLDWKLGEAIPYQGIHHFIKICIILWYYVSLIYIFATLNNSKLVYIFSSIAILSWILSIIHFKNEWGSIWCYYVNVAAVVALLF